MEAHKSEMMVVVSTLIESIADKDEAVRNAVNTSLRKLAKRHPQTVLEHGVVFRKQNPQLTTSHLTALLRTMVQICHEAADNVNGDTLVLLIEFSVNEMIANKDYVPDIQMPASNILVALGQAHCIEVMEGLLKHFQPGVLPHYSIIHTMGALASANAFGIVPFVKATLGTMLPMMGMLKNDAMKQVFSFALGKFSEAVLEYLANIEMAPDPTVNKMSYETEIHIAFDVLVNSWMNIREPKVCEAVLQAVGPMFALLSPTKVIELAPRLIVGMLNLHRRGIDSYPVTRCLAAILSVTFDINSVSVVPLLDNLLAHLFELVCGSPDYAQPQTVKNHCEVLRCFDQIAKHYSVKLVDFLIQHLKNNNERERLKALLVVTHLVNSSDSEIQARIPSLVTALKNMQGEQSIRVKKALLKTFIAFACRGYLNDDASVIEFILKNCCPSTSLQASKDPDSGHLLQDLRDTSSNALYLLATTVPQMEDSLWYLLLNYLLRSQFTPACSIIASCLSRLAVKRNEEEQSIAESTRKYSGVIPNPTDVFARCLVLLGNPRKANRGVNILNFLKSYVENLNLLLKPSWDNKIFELTDYLTDDKHVWSEQVWEDLLLEFLSLTLEKAGDEKWTLALCVKLMQQIPLCDEYDVDRYTLLRCLALTTCYTDDKQYVGQALDALLAGSRDNSVLDSKSCARALGICSRRHLTAVLVKLEHLVTVELSRKSSRLLGFMKDVKQEGEMGRTRLTALLAFGQVALEAPPEQVLPQIEKTIVNWVLEQLHSAKDMAVREAALITLNNVAKSLDLNNNRQRINLQNGTSILSLVLDQLQYSQLIPTILDVATNFVKLPPIHTSNERVNIARLCFEGVFELIASETEKETELCPLRNIDAILNSLSQLVKELLLESVTPDALDDIFTLLEPWLSKTNPQQRLASVNTLQNILQCYLDNVKFGFETPSKFSQCGLIIGTIVPRCTDPCMSVRQFAVKCINSTLCIADRYEGHSCDYDVELTNDISLLGKQLQTDDPNQLFNATSDLAKVICPKLPHGQVLQFIHTLLDGLLDNQAASSSGTSIFLNVFFRLKGSELYHHIHHILSSILEHLSKIQCTQTRTGCVRAVLPLAHHHLKAVVTALLERPLPYDENVCDLWSMVAQDTVLCADIIDQLIQLITSSPVYEDHKETEHLQIAALVPLSAICALHEIVKIAAVEKMVMQRYSELFSMLLIAFGSYIGASPPVSAPRHTDNKHEFVPNRNAYKLSPARVVQETFYSFLVRTKCEDAALVVLHNVNVGVGEGLSSYIDMIPHLARAICSRVPQYLPRIVVCLNQCGTSPHDPQRITVAAFFSELVCLQGEEVMVLREGVVNNLLNYLNDPSPVVRRLSLKGLACVSTFQDDQRCRHTQPVLLALIAGLDDQDLAHKDSISLEAMRGFSQMLQVIEEEHVHDIQVSVAIRIKPFFEKENVYIREAAFQMFGDLAKFGGLNSKAAFQEQVNNSLVCLLLHLADDEKSVIKACKYALRQVCPLLGADRMNQMMQDHLIDDASLHYPEFMADITKIMVDELSNQVPVLIMHALSYVKSSWPNVRGNAAMFVGLLCGLVVPSLDNKIPIETVSSRLVQLLKDRDSEVRAKTAEALSLLFANV